MQNSFGIYTSYFAKVMHHPDVRSGKLDPVCIATSQPNGFNLYTDYTFVPHKFLVADLKAKKITEALFRLRYNQLLDDRIKDINAINEMLKNTVLVCWEAPEKFCHRHIFAEWYVQKTGYSITELFADSMPTSLF